MELNNFKVPSDEKVIIAARDVVGDILVITKTKYGQFIINVKEALAGDDVEARVEFTERGLKELLYSVLDALDEVTSDFVVDEQYA